MAQSNLCPPLGTLSAVGASALASRERGAHGGAMRGAAFYAGSRSVSCGGPSRRRALSRRGPAWGGGRRPSRVGGQPHALMGNPSLRGRSVSVRGPHSATASTTKHRRCSRALQRHVQAVSTRVEQSAALCIARELLELTHSKAVQNSSARNHTRVKRISMMPFLIKERLLWLWS